MFSTQLQSKFAFAKGEALPEYSTEVPAHPALVHFPIALNALAWSIDIFYAIITTVGPTFLTSRFGDVATLSDMTRLSHFLMSAGLLLTLPAVASGSQQLLGMISKNGGLWEKDAEGKQKDTMVPKIAMTISHAIMNDIVFVLGVYNWYLRRSTSDTPNASNVPGATSLLLSFVSLPLLLAASKAGGTLIYNHGVGLNLGKKKVVKEYKPF